MRHQIRFTARKISARLVEIESYSYQLRNNLLPFMFKELEGPQLAEMRASRLATSGWIEIGDQEYWAKPRTNFLLKTSFTVPEEWSGKGEVALYLPIGVAGDFSHPEALLYINGQPIAAADRYHQEITLPPEFCDGQEHELLLHGWTGLGGSTVGDPNVRLKMNPCELVVVHQPTRDMAALTRTALGIIEHLDDNQPEKHKLLTALDEAYKILDLRIPIGGAYYQSVPEALSCLKKNLETCGNPLDVEITAIGHAHIDVAWLWTLAQTRQKAGRTFHTVQHLMKQYPQYQFTQSQPQLYEYLSQDFPALFEHIRNLVKARRWEPIGGMWVEADCNLSGPESLARQFLLGRLYFTEHFGKNADSPVLWLPDVFGYAWNLPQLIKEAGLEYFFTIKIGWSQYNRLPYDSFWWQGLDGTRVLTHFSTTKNPDSPFASTYNSDASPGQMIGTWMNFQQKDYASPGSTIPLLMSYGWGDGGGGATREMLENIAVMEKFPAAPQVKTGKVIDFFRKLDTEDARNLPIWNGELYLEYHRGTYTTQARNKRANRKSEFLLHDTEFLAAYASLIADEYQYPAEELTQAWKLVCLNQFHDIIPGSSIHEVYEESLAQYAEVAEAGEGIKQKALEIISKQVAGDLLVVNPTSFLQTGLVKLPGTDDFSRITCKGQDCAWQKLEDGVLVEIHDLEPYSISGLNFHSEETLSEQVIQLSVSSSHLENEFLRVELNAAGDINRIYDKQARREVLPEGAVANQWQAFEDRPLAWDAWDIEVYYDDKCWLAEPAESIRVVEHGPLRVSLETRRHILNSTYTQTISLERSSKRIDFDTHIDWQERKVLLKAAFPVDVLSPKATYEIQWGNVERPTHRNTSWDWARFETAAQKWVDLSEGGYGLSLLNDCKYGHDIFQNVIRLSLLRGTTAPDPEADLGEHRFRYSLFPHEGSWDVATVREAYALNDPLIAARNQTSGGKQPSISLLSVDRPNVVIETVKQAEDGNGLIVRLYEAMRKRGPVYLSTAFECASAWRTNILEEDQEELTVDGRSVCFEIKPYQIITLRLIPAAIPRGMQ